MPKISMVMSFMCPNHRKTVFDCLRMNFNAANTVLMCKTGINTNMLVGQCALNHVCQIRPGCVLIGTCALIRTNSVYIKCVIKEPFLSVSDYV